MAFHAESEPIGLNPLIFPRLIRPFKVILFLPQSFGRLGNAAKLAQLGCAETLPYPIMERIVTHAIALPEGMIFARRNLVALLESFLWMFFPRAVNDACLFITAGEAANFPMSPKRGLESF